MFMEFKKKVYNVIRWSYFIIYYVFLKEYISDR